MKTRLLLALLVMPLTSPAQAMSRHDAACGIWLCAPTGFGDGCGQSHREFRRRTLRGQPAMPPYMSCKADEGKNTAPAQNTLLNQPSSQFTSKEGVAAIIGEQRHCHRWSHGGSRNPSRCMDWDITPPTIIKDTRCTHYHTHDGRWESPKGCVGTKHYVDTFMNGKPVGNTFYW